MKHIRKLILKGWLSMLSYFWRAIWSCLVCYSLLLFLSSRMSLYLKWEFLISCYSAAKGKMTNLDINISFLIFASMQCSLQFTSIILWKNGNCLLPITQNALRYIFVLWIIMVYCFVLNSHTLESLGNTVVKWGFGEWRYLLFLNASREVACPGLKRTAMWIHCESAYIKMQNPKVYICLEWKQRNILNKEEGNTWE